MVHILKIAGKIIFVLFCIVVIIIITWAIWERNRDPLNAINQSTGAVTLLKDSILTLDDATREYRQILLNTERIGKIKAYLSLPLTYHDQKVPVIIILGGLNISADNFKAIPDPGNNAILIYDYPYSPKYWYDGTAFTQIPVIRNAVLTVPAQVVELARWADQQNWSNNSGCSILGYSFGSFFVPGVYHVADSRKIKLKPGVIAYGGTDIYQLLQTNLRKVAEPFKSIFAWLASTAIYPISPELHAPYLKNNFLVINSLYDRQITDTSWIKLHELIPDPKTVVILNKGHMHPRNPDLTKNLVKISKDWLVERGCINP
jgi:hypothetical protein